ncbi:TIGR02302 family protein [Shimia sp. MMG029]|uniref:TIGR02302 family protein n=1 Tax=Shimia sp. MMG029 TaxID=3021978 RepID=UPI0022FEDF93|nr:TIGR02302 family protein [Shimia sp. MMG029]MDA5558341.1 TIGR02302 family protein [Shimia sp. MMG029]
MIALTRLGLFAESLTRAFWPVWTILIVVLAALMTGVHEVLPLEVTWVGGVLAVVSLTCAVAIGARRFVFPTQEIAEARLDATLPGRPLQALRDTPAVGRGDAASEALWQAHQGRMVTRTESAKVVQPNLQISYLDPFGLRHIAMLFLMVALVFGSAANLTTIQDLGTPRGSALASGPAWEGWIEPPSYTGKPALYLNDLSEGALELPEGSHVLLRLYGEVGALTVAETVSGRTGPVESAADAEQSFEVTQSGMLDIAGPGGARWDIALLPDGAPTVMALAQPETSGRGEMTLPFEATDDYSVVGGSATVRLDLDAIERKYGLRVPPEARPDVDVPLPLPISGDRVYFQEVLIEDFSKHPWAHLPVEVTLTVKDDAGLTGTTGPMRFDLPARRFFDPLAAAIIELRRDLLWSKDNGARVAQLMRAISHRPEEGVFKQETDYLRFRTILTRLETNLTHGLSSEKRDEFAEALWALALDLEDGALGDAAERLRQAQERLSEAMKNGASESEIARLMQELREATDDYLRELARREPQQGDGQESQETAQNRMQLNQNDLQRMMDRIQELMEQGRMAEAQQALEELQRMMENMRVTQGQGQQGEGEQAMEGLADTLREQQGLSDEAFRELQEQFNPGAQSGQSSENQGFNGGEGRGQSHDGTGVEGRGEGEGQEGQSDGAQPGQSEALEDRQRALRQELNRQLGNLPGQGTPEGDAAREALDQAEGAMQGAEDALRQDDLATAIDRQAEAMDALREGLRNLGEAMAQQQQDGQQGTAEAQGNAQDPLGRSQGNRGAAGTQEGLLQGEDVYRQARRLLDEIRRRAGEAERPEIERNYLERLLDRF